MNERMQGKQRGKQRGAVLVLGLIFLMLLTIVGVVASQRSTLEMQMSGNFQTKLEYFEYARSVIDAAKVQPGILPIPIIVGYTRCTTAAAKPADISSCTETGMSVPSTAGVLPSGVSVDLSTTYAGMAAFAYQSEDSATGQGLLQMYRIAARVYSTDSKAADVRLEVGLVRLEPE